MHKHTIYFLLFIILLACFSCVPNKKLVYLQKDDLHKGFPKDSVLRSYDLAFNDYKIQPQDILTFSFKSISGEEFDVFDDFGQSNAAAAGNLGLQGEIVDPQGFIEFPLLGKVKVAGLTLFQIQEKINWMFEWVNYNRTSICFV